MKPKLANACLKKYSHSGIFLSRLQKASFCCILKNMSLNCNEIDEVLDELNLKDAFIQDIVQPGYDSIAFNVYKIADAKTILVCTAAGACRIHQTWKKVPKNTKPLRFMECLKSHIKGARIESIEQIGKERIIEIKLFRAGKIYVMTAANQVLGKKGDEEDEDNDEHYILYIRLWSNAGNIILCNEDGSIIDSMYRRPNKGEVTGGNFNPREELAKKKAEVEQSGIEKEERIWPVRKFEELGKAKDGQELSFNQKIDIWYGEHATALSRESLLLQAEKWYNSRKSRMQAALNRLEAKLKSFKDADRIKHQGDLILSFGYGADLSKGFIECTDYDNDDTVKITIDPKKSVQENASSYYEKYKKAISGQDELSHDIQMSKREIEELESLYAKMQNERNVLKIEQLLRKSTTPKQQKEKEQPGLEYNIEGWRILVGRNVNENDDLLRHYAKGQDMWMHTRDYAGGYVFIKARTGKTVPLNILLYAGNLAVYHSKGRKNGKADLYYTQVKHLRRAKNGPKGLVLPTNEKNICITLDSDILKKLDEIQEIQNGI